MDKYSQYIASLQWKQKREQRLKLDHYACRLCDEDGTNYRLEVHHRPSSYAKIPHESVEDDLITLCSFCHEIITSRIRERRYQSQDIQINHIEERIFTHGLENSEIPVDLSVSIDPPQWRIGKPDESPGPTDEKIEWQKIKDGGRPGATRQA